MAKTNEQILWEYGEKMRELHKEMENKLFHLEATGITWETKKSARDQIIWVFDSKMKRIERGKRYQRVLAQARKERRENNNLEKEWKLFLDFDAYESDKVLEKLYKLRDECVSFDEVNVMWREWRRFIVKLPAVWNFKWYQFDCVSLRRKSIRRVDYDRSTELQEKSYSVDDIKEFYLALRDFMKEIGFPVAMDHIEYNGAKVGDKFNKYACTVDECLDILTYEDLLGDYYLKDTKKMKHKGNGEYFEARAIWEYWGFDRSDQPASDLLLKSSLLF